MKTIKVSAEAILYFMRMSISCCIFPFAGFEPTENKKKLYKIAINNPGEKFNVSDILSQLPSSKKSVFGKDMERISAAAGGIKEINKQDILDYFLKDHIDFIISSAEGLPIKLGALLLAHTMMPCLITGKNGAIYEGEFVSISGKEGFSRKVDGLVNLTNRDIYLGNIVLIHFAGIVAILNNSSLGNPQDIAKTQIEISKGIIGKALEQGSEIDYRRFANTNLTQTTIDRLKEITQ